eukprot:364191-Chlamydomonas_euryale.AAC.2
MVCMRPRVFASRHSERHFCPQCQKFSSREVQGGPACTWRVHGHSPLRDWGSGCLRPPFPPRVKSRPGQETGMATQARIIIVCIVTHSGGGLRACHVQRCATTMMTRGAADICSGGMRPGSL